MDKKLEPQIFYRRYEDMSPTGFVQVYLQRDGDVVIMVRDEHGVEASVEFCASGGQSTRVRVALQDLAEAIMKVNDESPQYNRK